MVTTSTALNDEHSVLLWETCAYSSELIQAADSRAGLDAACEALLGFLHYRLLPYLCDEERRLCDSGLRDSAFADLVVADHERIRAHVETLAASRTSRLRVISTRALVDCLDRHVQREQSWVLDSGGAASALHAGAVVTPVTAAPVPGWALPLALSEHVDLDDLPEAIAEELVLQKIQRMRHAEVFWLHASRDLHCLWLRQQSNDPGRHSWVYEQEGPHEWIVRISRRDDEDLWS